jgi:hypothetical protein
VRDNVHGEFLTQGCDFNIIIYGAILQLISPILQLISRCYTNSNCVFASPFRSDLPICFFNYYFQKTIRVVKSLVGGSTGGS